MGIAINLIRMVLVGIGLVRRPDLVGTLSAEHPDPDLLGTGQLVVVGSGALRKWAILRCPCGCGEKIMLSLAPNRRPRWSVTLDWLGRPSLHPSVRQLDGCRAHFWIRRGRVEWCHDSGAAPCREG